MNNVCRAGYRIPCLLMKRGISSNSGTSLKIANEILDKANAGTSLVVIGSEIGNANGGTSVQISQSKINNVNAGTSLVVFISEIGSAKCGTSLKIQSKSKINTAKAGTSATIQNSEIQEKVTAGTAIHFQNSTTKFLKAGTSVYIDNSKITASAEAGCEATVENDSEITMLTCSISQEKPMLITSSTINELFLRTSDSGYISGDKVSGNIINSGNFYSFGLFSYTRINGVRDFWILGIPVSKICRFTKKILVKGAESKPYIVILKDSKVNKITFDKKGGEVHLKGNSHVEIVNRGIVKKT